MTANDYKGNRLDKGDRVKHIETGLRGEVVYINGDWVAVNLQGITFNGVPHYCKGYQLLKV